MPNDYYPAPEEGTEPSSTIPPPKDEQGDTEEGASALLPKSVLGGQDFKPGEEVVLQIKHVYSDEVEVAYAPKKPEEKTKSTMSPDEEIDMMDSAKPAPQMGMAGA